MVRYKAIISYDGTNFSGFQRQPKGRTVQSELEVTLSKMASQPIKSMRQAERMRVYMRLDK